MSAHDSAACCSGYSHSRLPAAMCSIPAVFTEEITLASVPMGRIGWIKGIVASGRAYRVTYHLPSSLPSIRADHLAEALGLTNTPSAVGDMQHSKWQLSKGDLFKTLCNAGLLDGPATTVFAPVQEPVNPRLVSAMMPFSREYDAVYEAIAAAASEAGGECERADNVWEHSTIIQDYTASSTSQLSSFVISAARTRTSSTRPGSRIHSVVR